MATLSVVYVFHLLPAVSVHLHSQCLKESYVKALGSGIGFDVSRLCFDVGCTNVSSDLVTETSSLSVDGVPICGWTFEETMIDDHCVAMSIGPEMSDVVRT